MKPSESISGSRKHGGLALSLFCAAALLLSAASAPAVASEGPILPAARSETSLVFTAETARLVGSTALVPVRCLGSQAQSCTGTVTLTAGARKHRAPFSLVGGSSQSLAVPVGAGGDLSKGRAVAVARTAQPAGGYARSSDVLHFH